MPRLDGMNANTLRAWLKSKGYKAGQVEKIKMAMLKDKKQAILDLCGVTEQEYRSAVGR